MLKYKKLNIAYAKELREDMTEQERKLWYNFLKKYPVRFQRQKAIDNFIADFYCASVKLVIELDGSQHYSKDGKSYDGFRTEKLEQFGITVLRICNGEIDRNFKNACAYIDSTVKSLTEEKEINKASTYTTV